MDRYRGQSEFKESSEEYFEIIFNWKYTIDIRYETNNLKKSQEAGCVFSVSSDSLWPHGLSHGA